MKRKAARVFDLDADAGTIDEEKLAAQMTIGKEFKTMQW